MTWGVFQQFVTARTQGTFHGGPKKSMGVENRLYNQLYRSFGLSNKVSLKFVWVESPLDAYGRPQ